MKPQRQSDTAEFVAPTSPAEQAPGVTAAQVEVGLGSLSHQGRVRPNNEDHYLVARFGRFLETLGTNLPAGSLPLRHEEAGYGLAVADGMGGMAAGEVASRLVIQGLINLVLSTPDWMLASNEVLAEVVLRRMAERFRQLNELLLRQADAEPDLAGMGTTLTVACSFGLDLILCHIGDSRAYLFRGGELRQLTHDMTTAQMLVDAGLLSAAEAARHRLRHMLTQSLGQDGKVTAQVKDLPLMGGDRLLLCTDGLTEMVEGKEIAGVLQTVAPPQAACQALVDLALAGGGRDNVTVVLANYRVAPGPAGT